MAANAFNVQMLGIQDLVSEVEAFQTWVSAANATEAKDSIYLYRETPPSATKWAVLAKDDSWRWQRQTSGAGLVAGMPSAQCRLEFWQTVSAYSEAAIVNFLDEVAGIIGGALDIHGGTGARAEVIDAIEEVPHAMRDAGQRPTYRFKIGSDRGYMIAFLIKRRNR